MATPQVGDVFATARIAGIQAAKRTWERSRCAATRYR